jgi:hypothetical protein
MPDREQRHILDDIAEPVQEENHADEKHQVVVAGHHVLRAEIKEWPDGSALVRFDELRVVVGNAVCIRYRREHDQQAQRHQ